jgi:DNA-directed RNA polymerase specialized sigma24 family protein
MTREFSILRGNSREPAMFSSRAVHESEDLTKSWWTYLVTSIRAGDPTGPMQLYSTFARGLQFILARQTACHSVEDKVLDVLRNVTLEIRRGRLTKHGDLPHLVLTMARRSVERHSSRLGLREREAEISAQIAFVRPKLEAETQQIIERKTQLAQQALALLDLKQREILTRWYLRGQRDAQICAEMKLTETEVQNCTTQYRNSFDGANRNPPSIGHFRINPETCDRCA